MSGCKESRRSAAPRHAPSSPRLSKQHREDSGGLGGRGGRCGGQMLEDEVS